jgi:hypothetical protein
MESVSHASVQSAAVASARPACDGMETYVAIN